ncbi:hypothetical protein SMC26_13550 [Actinomadura fulvescens]|uniref:PE domain-containing protein n=1 Tax=Actinomadura fulvescens TaxID=46160 RepID=A0ABN3PKE5_9ACTN
MGFIGDAYWPGLDPADKGFEIDREEVRRIVGVLRKDIESYGSGAGCPQHLSQWSDLPPDALGDIPGSQGGFPAAQVLAGSARNAHAHIATQYQRFVDSYRAVADAIAKAVDNLDDMEGTNASTANAAATGTDTRPGI